MSLQNAPVNTPINNNREMINNLAWRQWFEQLVREVNNSMATSTDYAEEFDYDGLGNLQYFGKADPGSNTSSSVWQIRKITYAGANMSSILFANGSNSFNSAWTDRANLSYS
jgi:hypothetical protein